MDAIEKRARELLDISYREVGQNEHAYHVGCGSDLDAGDQAAVRAIIAALLLGRLVDLLDQDGASRIEPQELQVVPAAALGADETGAVGVDQVSGGLPRDIQLAEVASEHRAGVRPEGDGQATADHVRGEGVKGASAVHDRARSRAGQAHHQGEGACE